MKNEYLEKTGIELIAQERARQIQEEYYDAEHDANHDEEELASAAACYATPDSKRHYTYETLDGKKIPDGWPWSPVYWKPTPNDRIRELMKAGALNAAEIDRLRHYYKTLEKLKIAEGYESETEED